MNFTDKFLKDLAQFVPGLTGAQALKSYFNGDAETMKAFLRAQQAEGMIRLTTELVRERRHSNDPIISLRCGEAGPSAYKVAYAASQRWTEVINPVLIIRGTAKLQTIYGGEPNTIVTANLSHEIALTDVFLSKRQQQGPEFVWHLIHSRPGMGALPDAISAGAWIEVIGRYSGSMVAAKLEIAARANLEIW
jgi:hypothetical protein